MAYESAEFSGEFTDGETSDVHAYSVRVFVDHLQIREKGERLADWPRVHTKIDSSYSGEIHLLHESMPGAALVIKDPAFADALAAAGWKRKPFAQNQLMMVLVGCVGIFVLTLYFTITPLSFFIAKKIPADYEQSMGEKIGAQFASKQCKNPEAVGILEKMVLRLKGPEKRAFRPILVQDETVNAYAVPGGLILVNSGFLEKAESSDEVAGVLAHEMEHVSRLHATTSLIRGLILSGAWQLTMGDFSGLMIVDPTTVYNLASLKFSRDMEREADAGGLKRLDRAKISRRGFVDFFRRMEKDHKGMAMPEFMSSHPSDENRWEKALSRKDVKNTTPALTAGEWKVLKDGCRDKDAAKEKNKVSSDPK